MSKLFFYFAKYTSRYDGYRVGGVKIWFRVYITHFNTK